MSTPGSASEDSADDHCVAAIQQRDGPGICQGIRTGIFIYNYFVISFGACLLTNLSSNVLARFAACTVAFCFAAAALYLSVTSTISV